MTRGLLCDVHGVLYTFPDPVPGSVEAVRRLVDSGFPHLFLTNTSLHPKGWILQSLHKMGFSVDPDRLITAVEVAGEAIRERGHRRVGWLCAPGLNEDLPGLEPVLPEAGAPDSVDVVLVGDLGPGFTYEVLNQAFRWIRSGAELMAIARNRFYQSKDGLVLDSGPFLSLLENAGEVDASVVGKPSPGFFEIGLRRLGMSPSEVAMIGDDTEGDVLPAMALGIRGVQVKTGKYRAEDYQERGRPADHLVADLAGAVDLILGSDHPCHGEGTSL